MHRGPQFVRNSFIGGGIQQNSPGYGKGGGGGGGRAALSFRKVSPWADDSRAKGKGLCGRSFIDEGGPCKRSGTPWPGETGSSGELLTTRKKKKRTGGEKKKEGFLGGKVVNKQRGRLSAPRKPRALRKGGRKRGNGPIAIAVAKSEERELSESYSAKGNSE